MVKDYTLSVRSLYQALLFAFLAYNLNFVSFLSGFLGGRTGKNTVEQAASGNIVNQITGLLILGLCIAIFLYSKRINWQNFVLENKVLSIILLLFLSSVIWSEESFVSLRRFIAFFTIIIGCYCVTQIYSTRSLLSLLLNCMVAITVIGFVYTLASGKQISFGFSSRELGMSGVFTDKNAAARFYGYAIILQVALMRYRSKIDIVFLATLTLCLLLAQSVSGVGITLIGVGLLVSFRIFKGRNQQQTFFRLVALLLLLASAVIAFSLLYEFILALFGRDPTMTNRAIIWELLMPFVYDKFLLGYGFAAFWASSAAGEFIARWGFIGNAHSGYFEIMLSLGVIGLATKILFLIHCLWLSLKSYVAGNTYAPWFITVMVIQTVLNYVGFVIFNHNSTDMVVFFVCYFLLVKELSFSQKLSP
jgi:O-antigen ligase